MNASPDDSPARFALPTAPSVPLRPPLVREAHGERWEDEHAWLRAADWQGVVRDPATLPDGIRHWLAAENAHAEALFEPLATLRAALVEELRGRIEPREESLPDDLGPWRYLDRCLDGDEHGVCLRAPRPGARGGIDDAGRDGRTSARGEERVILDLEAESEGSDGFSVGAVEPSPDHRHLAWTVDEDGAELYRLLIRDLDTLEDIEEIDEVGDVAWATGKVLFYTRLDEALRPSRVYRHVLGTDPEEDVLIHEERDERFECWVGTSRSREYVFIGAEMSDTSEVRVVPARTPFAEPVLLEPRTAGLEYSVEHQRERFVILSNADGAIDFALFEAPCDAASRANWRVIVPHVPGRTILDVHASGEWLTWIEREEALPRVRWQGANGALHTFEVDETAYSLSLEPLAEFESGAVRVAYSSPTTPERTWEVDLASGARTLVKEQGIPSGHDPSRYRTSRIQAISADGSEVPVTLLHLADTPLDGTAPGLLYVYGAYGSSLPAAFDAGQLPLVERGFVYAIAHVRGGQEKGRAWYEASRFGGRERVVEDLIAVGETLVATGVCAPGRIVLHGASAGGLVVGAALNVAAASNETSGEGARRTDGTADAVAAADERDSSIGRANGSGDGKSEVSGPWGGAIMDVPFVDALNTMLDASLPLTPGEWSEWGNPIESREAFEDIRRHSPCDNIARGAYPPMLVTAGIADSRVMWWEPAKWVARLRERRTGEAPIALFTNLSTGHFGESGRYAGLDEEARALAFAIAAVGGGGAA